MKWFDNDNRWVKILNFLEHKERVDIEILARKLNVSSKTIKNDIKKIEDDLEDSAIINFKNQSYSLYILDSEKYNEKKNEIDRINGYFESPIMRMAFIFETLMNATTPVLIDEIAYAMNVGRSTLLSDMRKLKGFLAKYDLSVIGKTNSGISLEGDELNIRYFIFENLYSIIYSEENLDENIQEIIEEVFKEVNFDKLTVNIFKKFLFISFSRIKSGRNISLSDDILKRLTSNVFFERISELTDTVGKILDTDFDIQEKAFLTIPIAGMRTPLVIDALEENLEVPDEVISIVQRIVTKVKEEMDLTISLSEVLNEFIYHIYFLMNRLRFGYPINNPIKDDIKKKYPMAYRMALLAKDVIESSGEYIMSEDEVGFLASYFEIFMEEHRNIKVRDYNIGFVSAGGKATSRLIIYQLKSLFDSNTVFETIPEAEVSSCNLDKYDLIITNTKSDIDSVVPVIYIDELIDKNMLIQKIESYRFIRNIDIPLINGIKSIMFSILKSEDFVVLDEDTSYEEDLGRLIETVTENHNLEEDFRERIFNREKMASTVFSENIAFPHAIVKNSKVPVISLGVKQNSGKGPKMIFLVGIPKLSDDSTLLVQLYDEIVKISEDVNAVTLLSNAKTYQELMLLLISGTNLFRR